MNGVTLLDEFQKIEDSLLGKVADMFIYETMKRYYDEKIQDNSSESRMSRIDGGRHGTFYFSLGKYSQDDKE